MTISAKVIADSISLQGCRLTTMQLRYPRFIHSEFMTHRVFSRNASSSRAIPVAKMIAQVRDEPAMPVHWGKNQPGMQAFEELNADGRQDAMDRWMWAAGQAADAAEGMMNAGIHKQVANRILEPFLHISVIVTATEWANFYALRNHPDAQPEIRELAKAMLSAHLLSKPISREHGWGAANWHLPYVTEEEHNTLAVELLPKISAARCARVSYLTHDGHAPSCEEDLKLFERLVGSKPLHASPIEHQAIPAGNSFAQSRNFRGWTQHREIFENAQ